MKMELEKYLEKESPFCWRISRDKVAGMNVDARIFASEELLKQAIKDDSLQQVINVACLQGIVGSSLAMPDIHSGYGFCIGGVAAFDAEVGIVSPGGVGYDINCGVRLITTRIERQDIQQWLSTIGSLILKRIPSGLTDRSNYRFHQKEFVRFLKHGAREVLEKIGGNRDDLEGIESGGELPFDDLQVISSRALERGQDQLGTLGSGNHFIEIQEVAEIYDSAVAARFGLQPNTITILIHTGSRGFGHQIASDYIEIFRRKNLSRVKLRDPQLIYAAISSIEGKNYLHALNAAANFAWANRQLIMEEIVAILEKVFQQSREKLGIKLLYDQAHNIAKFEEHQVGGEKKKLLVHRKGATRAFPAGHPELSSCFREIGQPVLIPGSMGTASYVLVGCQQALKLTFGSAAHGAGRKMSRHQAINFARNLNIRDELKRKDIEVFSFSAKGLKEEIPEAYKAVEEVVEVTAAAGLARKVARLVPLVVIKG